MRNGGISERNPAREEGNSLYNKVGKDRIQNEPQTANAATVFRKLEEVSITNF